MIQKTLLRFVVVVILLLHRTQQRRTPKAGRNIVGSEMSSRKQRGYDTQRIVANYLRTAGWPFAEPVGAGRPGSDVTGVVGVDIEVKARRGLDLTGTLRQQSLRAADGVLGLAVIRPDGYGPTTIEEWPALLTFKNAAQLLKDAGYQ